MRIDELDLSKILEGIAILVSLLCRKINLDSDKSCKVISNGLTGFSTCYLLLGCMALDDDFIMTVLRFLQRYWIGICLYILLFALIPPAVASWEKNEKSPNETIICQVEQNL